MTVLQIILTLSCFCFIQADYYISSATSHRENARDACRLATPDIRYSEEGNTVVLNTTHFPDGGKLWVGYALELTTFLYIGCSKSDDLKDNATMSNISKKDPGQCYSFCNTRFFGIQENNCYCIYSPPKNIGRHGCTSKCDNPQNTLCGQHENDGKDVSLYMTVNNPTDSESNGQFCQAVQRSSKDSNFSWIYEWETCDKELQFICQNGSYTESSQHYFVIRAKMMWQDSVKTCYEVGRYTTEKLDGMNQNITDTNKRWIGKIRSFVIKNTTDESNFNNLDVRQGYIEWDDENVIFAFEPSVEDRLYALCNQEHDTTSTHVSTAQSKYAAVLVPSITLASVITVVVILLILHWKRKNAEDTGDNSAVGQENDLKSARSRKAVSNESYQDSGERHEYFILEPGNEYAAIKDADVKATVDNEYDTTTNMQSKANVDTSNIYNKLEYITDATYNHTNTEAVIVEDTHDKITIDEQDSTYNTIDIPAGSKTGNDKSH